MALKSSSGNNFFNGISLTCGTICAIFLIISVTISGSPFEMIHKLNAANILPPMWLWGFLTSVWGFLIGYAAGLIIFEAVCNKSHNEREICAYKGGLFFLAALFLFVLHYPLFFVAERLFTALLAALVAAACACLCAFFWSKTSALAAVIIVSYAFWLFYVVFVTLSIIVQN